MIEGRVGGCSAQCREHGACGGLRIYHQVSSVAFHRLKYDHMRKRTKNVDMFYPVRR